MAREIDRVMVCSDCLIFIANGDLTGLDNGPEADKRAAEIIAGVDRLQSDKGGYVYAGDSENDNEFSWRDCSCCGSRLGGSRHECIILADD